MTRLFFMVAFVFFSQAALAQLVDNKGGGNNDAGSGIIEQGENATDTFAGLTFQVQRLVRDPSTPNAFRLILRVIETEKTGRRIALVQPAATLVDELGNVYYVANSTGIRICTERGKAWSYGVNHCARYGEATPVIMTPSQPTPVVMTILPYEDAFSPELAALATNASLTARFGIYSSDLKDRKFHDVVINGIQLPGGGS